MTTLTLILTLKTLTTLNLTPGRSLGREKITWGISGGDHKGKLAGEFTRGEIKVGNSPASPIYRARLMMRFRQHQRNDEVDKYI